MNVVCRTCGQGLDKKYYKKYGIILLVSCLPMFPFLMFVAYGTVIPFLYVILSVILGCSLIFRKEKYYYFCNQCKCRRKHPKL